MELIIDADACPVIDLAINIVKKYNINCKLVCDTSHSIYRPNAETIIVSKGNDSADYKIVNMIFPGDIVITQDYGLAAMCMSKNANIIDQNGRIYDKSNIDFLLMMRHDSKQLRNRGVHIKGPQKRTSKNNEDFIKNFSFLVNKLYNNGD